MRRIIPIVLGLVVLLSTASASFAARPGPTTHPISLAVGTVQVSAVCIGGGEPCSDTVRLSFTGTVRGQLPFSELKGIKDPQTVLGTFDFPMSSYVEETGCFSGVTGVIKLLVPQGSGSRLAFELDAENPSAGCGGGFSGTFAVDSAETKLRTFQQATGSGTFSLSTDLDLTAVTVSVVQLNVDGVLTLAH